jgi:hypothetical protein
VHRREAAPRLEFRPSRWKKIGEFRIGHRESNSFDEPITYSLAQHCEQAPLISAASVR